MGCDESRLVDEEGVQGERRGRAQGSWGEAQGRVGPATRRAGIQFPPASGVKLTALTGHAQPHMCLRWLIYPAGKMLSVLQELKEDN